MFPYDFERRSREGLAKVGYCYDLCLILDIYAAMQCNVSNQVLQLFQPTIYQWMETLVSFKIFSLLNYTVHLNPKDHLHVLGDRILFCIKDAISWQNTALSKSF